MSRRAASASGLAVVGLLFALRLFLIWKSQAIPPHFYCDSTSHLLVGFLTFKGVLPWSWRFFPLPGTLYAIGVKCGLDVLYSPYVVNGALAAIGLCCLYGGTLELVDCPTACLAAVLVVSLPSFTRLVFSADQEMTALALSGAAFWCAARGRSLGERSKFLAHMAAVGFLGLALYARSESAGFLILCAGVAAVGWRKKWTYSAAILSWALFWTALRLPSVLAHMHATQANNAVVAASTSLFGRVSTFPLSLADNWPLNIVFLSGFGIFACGSPLAAVLCGLMSVQALMLWACSLSFAASWGEPERNLCLILAGLAVPSAVVVRTGLARLPRRAAIPAGVLLAVLIGASWKTTIGRGPRVLDRIEENRLLGWKLRQLGAHGGLGAPNSLILLESTNADWPNAVVFSGLQDRLRIVSAANLEWGASLAWNGSGPVGAVVVRSQSALRSLKTKLRVGKLVARDGPFEIYEASAL